MWVIILFNDCHTHMLTHIRHHSRWVLDPGSQDYISHTILLHNLHKILHIFPLSRTNRFQRTLSLSYGSAPGMVARGPARLPIQSGDPRGTRCPSTQQALWTDKGPSGHGETAEERTASLKQYWFPIRAHPA